MNQRDYALVLVLALGAASARGETYIVDVDAYPLYRKSVVLGNDVLVREDVAAVRWEILAGAIELVKGPDRVKFRLAPLVWERVKNEYHLRLTALPPRVYAYHPGKGTILVPKSMGRDPSRLSVLSWRGQSDAPLLSGGVAALFGQIVGHYGYRGRNGSGERVCKLTDALLYADNEKHGRRLSSFAGWLFAFEWDHPKYDRTWSFGLLQKCFCIGRSAGKPYGRFLWLPLGKAPRLWPQLDEWKRAWKEKRLRRKPERDQGNEVTV